AEDEAVRADGARALRERAAARGSPAPAAAPASVSCTTCVIAVNRPVREPCGTSHVFTAAWRRRALHALFFHEILLPQSARPPQRRPRKSPMIRPLLAISLACSLFTAVAPTQGEVRPGPWPTTSKVPPGWVVHNTKNYHIQS